MTTMAKNTNVPVKYGVDQLSDMLNEIMLGKDAPLTQREIFEMLDGLGDDQFTELNAEYWRPKENKTYNFIFEGMDSAVLQGRKVRTVKLRDIDGVLFISAATVLVNTLLSVQTVPCYCRVIVGEKKKAKEGEYYDMSVKALPGTRVNQISQPDKPAPVSASEPVVAEDLPF